jgi:hypothetical protein
MNTIILFYIISGIVLIILIWILMIEIRLKKMFAGTKARNLEEMIVIVGKKINQIEEKEKEIDKHLIKVDDRLNKSIRKIETIRFNPFIDAGSNQSFAIALMNDEGNGVVMSSLYARDRMSIFAKPIVNGKSEFELSSEEKEVLDKAIK